MQAISYGSAMDAIAMAEHFCGTGDEAPSSAARAWWGNEDGFGEGAVARRAMLIELAVSICDCVDEETHDILSDKYGGAWDWEVLPVLIETVFTWSAEGKVELDWDAPLRHIAEVVREHKEDQTDG